MLSYFNCQQNFLRNSIWTYTITALQVKQWEIPAKEFTLDVNSDLEGAFSLED